MQKTILFAVSLLMVFAAAAQADLVGLWHLDGNTNDSSGKGNDGTIIGTLSYVTGYSGQALAFDGGSNYVDCGNDPSLKPVTNMTIAMWVNPGASQHTYADILGGHQYNQGYVVQQNGTDTNAYYFAYNRDGTYTGWQGTGIVTHLTPGKWQQFVVQKDGNTIRHYVDGVLTASGTVSGDIFYRPGEDFYLGIGYLPWSGRNFTGTLDEVSIWNGVVAPGAVPIPGAVLLGALGLSVAGWRLRRETV